MLLLVAVLLMPPSTDTKAVRLADRIGAFCCGTGFCGVPPAELITTVGTALMIGAWNSGS